MSLKTGESGKRKRCEIPCVYGTAQRCSQIFRYIRTHHLLWWCNNSRGRAYILSDNHNRVRLTEEQEACEGWRGTTTNSTYEQSDFSLANCKKKEGFQYFQHSQSVMAIPTTNSSRCLLQPNIYLSHELDDSVLQVPPQNYTLMVPDSTWGALFQFLLGCLVFTRHTSMCLTWHKRQTSGLHSPYTRYFPAVMLSTRACTNGNVCGVSREHFAQKYFQHQNIWWRFMEKGKEEQWFVSLAEAGEEEKTNVDNRIPKNRLALILKPKER